MTKMIEIFTDLSECPTHTQDFLVEKIDDYNYILKARPADENAGYETATYFTSKKYFTIKVELSTLSFAQQQVDCKGNTKRLKFLIHSIGIGIGLFYFITDVDDERWVRLIFFYWLSYIIFVYYTKTMREEIVLAVRKSIIRKTFIKGNRRR